MSWIFVESVAFILLLLLSFHFAMLLNAALNLKLKEVEVLANEKKAKDDAEKVRVHAIIQQIEQNHRDPVVKK